MHIALKYHHDENPLTSTNDARWHHISELWISTEVEETFDLINKIKHKKGSIRQVSSASVLVGKNLWVSMIKNYPCILCMALVQRDIS